MQIYRRAGKRWSSILLVFLVLLLLVNAESFGAGASKSAGAPASVKVAIISPEETKVLIDIGADPVLVDTRAEEAFRKMHITGAINLPWKEVIVKPADLPRNRLLVLYCDCSDESTAIDVAGQLIRNWGYTDVKVLKSGLSGWICLGYPMEGDPAETNRCQ
jgi:rhodanese-related sulfurtransferase